MAKSVEKEKPEKKPILFNINSIRTDSFYENNVPNEQIKKGKCNIGFGLNVDSKKGKLIFPVKVDFFTEDDVSIFGIETIHAFKIKDFESHIKKDEDGEYNIPNGLIERLLGLAISGTRGMLVVSVTLPEYKKIFLPLVDISKLLILMKDDPEFAKEANE